VKHSTISRRLLPIAALCVAAVLGVTACSNTTKTSGGSSGGSDSTPHFSQLVMWVGSTPGGSIDTVSRVIAPKLGQLLHTTVVVQNLAGADGIAAAATMLQKGDDCSNIMTTYWPGINYTFGEDGAHYQPSDFVALANATADYADIRVQNDAKWKTFQDFVNDAKANPGKISVSVQTVGGSNGAGMKALEQAAGIKLNLVAFGGSGDKARAALLGRSVDANASNVFNGQSISTKTRVLAVQTATNNWPDLTNNAPTMSSVLGKTVPDATSLYGWTASAKCVSAHPDTAKAVAKAIIAAEQDPSFKAAYDKLNETGLIKVLSGSDLQAALDTSAKVNGTPSMKALDINSD
jgi:tripartite-type tricarboxylate transporter receptor subunit TctC